MKFEDISYPAKVMLVGEYGVILGGSALTIPFKRLTTQPRSIKKIGSKEKDIAAASSKSIQKMFSYLETIPLERFHARFNKNLFAEQLCEIWYESSIPDGYGLGSSGALSACIYRQFFEGTEHLSLEEMKNDFSLIESYYHGKSSGVDALTSFTGSSLYFKDDGHIEAVKLDLKDLPMGYRFFLLNTHAKYETGPLVEAFFDRMQDEGFKKLIEEDYLPMNRKFIESLLGTRDADPAMIFRVISDFQHTHFRRMIPDSMLDTWIDGQVGNEYYLKLSGAGGGYLLGMCHYTAIDTVKRRFGDDLMWVE